VVCANAVGPNATKVTKTVAMTRRSLRIRFELLAEEFPGIGVLFIFVLLISYFLTIIIKVTEPNIIFGWVLWVPLAGKPKDEKRRAKQLYSLP